MEGASSVDRRAGATAEAQPFHVTEATDDSMRTLPPRSADMFRPRRLLPPLLLFFLLIAALPLRADDRPPWRLIGPDGATTTSQCIGRPETPLCAVETLLACFQRSAADLCQGVDDNAGQYAEVFHDPSPSDHYLAYRVLEERQAPSADGAELVVEQQEAETGHPISAEPGQVGLFRLHRLPDGRWKITDWGDPADLD